MHYVQFILTTHNPTFPFQAFIPILSPNFLHYKLGLVRLKVFRFGF